MTSLNLLVRGAGWIGAALAGFAAQADYPVYLINPTDQPWRLVCTKPFLPLRVSTQDGAGGLIVTDHQAYPHPLLAPLDPEFKGFQFEFVLPGRSTAKVETTAPVESGRAEFLLVDHQGRELDDSHAVRETVCYWVRPDELSSRRDAMGRPVTVGRVCYDHRAPAGVMAENLRSPSILIFTGASWGLTGTRTFPGLEATRLGDPEPEETKNLPVAGAGKDTRGASRAAGALGERNPNRVSAGPRRAPAKPKPDPAKIQEHKAANKENVAPRCQGFMGSSGNGAPASGPG